MREIPQDAELSGRDGLIIWRPKSRPLNGAWWGSDIPDPSPETSAAIWRIEGELRGDR